MPSESLKNLVCDFILQFGWIATRLVSKKNFKYFRICFQDMNVDGIIVGSEVLYRGDMSIETLLQYIQRVKTVIEGRGVSITSADTFDKITPELAAPLDFVMM